jgi:hypothetical protein
MSSQTGSTPEPSATPQQILEAEKASSHLAKEAFDAAVRVIPSHDDDHPTEGPRTIMTGTSSGNGTDMDDAMNTSGTWLSCTNTDCPCELRIKTPCPHGASYTCACGHPFEAVAQS